MIYLADVNFWLALVFERHVHHRAAAQWFEERLDGECLFCRATQQAFLRLANNPKMAGPDAVSVSAAWQLYDELISDPRVEFVSEPPSLEPVWRGIMQGDACRPKAWQDAYIAAFASVQGCGLVTFDRGFRQFQNLALVVLPQT